MQDDKRKEKTMVALKKFLCVNVRVLLAAECVGEFSVVAKTLPSLVLLHFVSKLSVDIYEVTTQDRGRLTLSSESPVSKTHLRAQLLVCIPLVHGPTCAI